MKHFLKNNGSILQLVLIIFMVLILNINILYLNIIENSKAIKQSIEINEKRLIELTVIRYYKEMILNDILISDLITIDDYQIYYTVDDFGNYYYIETTITQKELEYRFNLEIELDTLVILSFEYQ